ncbi:MAG: hypothetical protein IM496_14625 [Microcystis sp. M049S2]|uniref:hypothetical protein n=1 Tax=Microcystis sp. M049S2 TaxID=2771169 RepID=UPI00258C7F72|nr:hypothetical protein [Microcystis sp. M049S2]MCA2659685.1 hypothetical protein [Microcystis sp. M049S2]
MDIESTKVTPEEIAQFRAELADNLSVIAALDAIEECEGYLEDAVPLLLMRETGTEPDRSIGDLLKKCRQFICQEEVREGLQSGMIAPFIEPISVSAGIPVGVATAIGICAFKLGMKKVCANSET